MKFLFLLLLFRFWLMRNARGDTTSNEIAVGDVTCEAGWQLIDGQCVTFVYSDQPSTFDQAMTTCQNFHAILPIAHLQFDWNRVLTQITASPASNDSWLGLRYKPQNSSFLWMDGFKIDWTNFLVNPYPVNRTRTNCVYAQSAANFQWVVQDCLQAVPFICIRNGSTPTSLLQTTPTLASQSPSARLGIDKPTVALSTTNKVMMTTTTVPTLNFSSWMQANINCLQQNRTLLLTNSRQDWINFQISRMSLPNMDNLWIGLWYDSKNQRIQLSDGNAWLLETGDWFPWFNGQAPSVFPNDDQCVASTKRLNYLWDFEACNQSGYNGLCYNKMEFTTASVAITTTTSTRANVFTVNMRAKTTVQPMQKAAAQQLQRSFIPKEFEHRKNHNRQSRFSLIIRSLFRFDPTRTFFVSVDESPIKCKLVAILLHYFFTCAYVFMLFEALQMMYIIGHVNTSGSILPTYIILAVGWGGPLGLIAITGPVIGDEYSTYWTCWGDLERRFGWALFFPMACICSTTVIIVESAGMMNQQDPPYDADPTQLFSAKISQRGIVIVMSLTLASHILGIMAVYFQIVYLYVACFGINVSNGVAVIFFHTAIDAKIRQFVVKFWRKMKGFLKTLCCHV